MARGGRGGPRQGVQGRSYQNRSDMQQGIRKPSLPTVAPAAGQPYGAQADQLRSLAALPLAPATASAASVPNGTGAAPLPPMLPIDRPTERPNEPVTAGAATGPGPGSITAGMDAPDDLAGLVDRLAASANSPELTQLASYLTSGRG